jgi:hypothetical protein
VLDNAGNKGDLRSLAAKTVLYSFPLLSVCHLQEARLVYGDHTLGQDSRHGHRARYVDSVLSLLGTGLRGGFCRSTRAPPGGGVWFDFIRQQWPVSPVYHGVVARCHPLQSSLDILLAHAECRL